MKIDENRTYVGIMEFKDLGLTQVNIPFGIIDIRASAFENNNLTEVKIPSGVRSIGSQAFYGNKITLVTIPKTCVYLDPNAFDPGIKIVRL